MFRLKKRDNKKELKKDKAKYTGRYRKKQSNSKKVKN